MKPWLSIETDGVTLHVPLPGGDVTIPLNHEGIEALIGEGAERWEQNREKLTRKLAELGSDWLVKQVLKKIP